MNQERPSIEIVQKRLKEIKNKDIKCPNDGNKGKAGLIIEQQVGIPTSSECLDCTDGELKSVPVETASPRIRIGISGKNMPMETTAVTMANLESLEKDDWSESRVKKKTNKVLFTEYKRFKKNDKEYIRCMNSVLFDENPKFNKVRKILEEDYIKIQKYYKENHKTKSKIGTLLQVRTKGSGNKKKKENYKRTFAYFFRKQFVLYLFGNLSEKEKVRIGLND